MEINVERDKVIARVRKMLNLANDAGASEGERDNAMRMAHKLMVKFNIDSLALEKEGTIKAEKRVELNSDFYGRPWARNVAWNVARLFFCSYLYKPHYGKKTVEHSFIGRESNAITASEIARFAIESIHREGRRLQKASYANNDWFRSFCWGAADSIVKRVDQMIAEATKPIETLNGPEPEYSRSTALVVANLYQVEATENRAMIELKYPKLRSGQSGRTTFSSDARERGQRYGNSVSLSRQVGDTRIKGQLK